MEASHCSCARKGNLTYFCIEQACKLDPRLCANCRREHNNHNMIEIYHLQSLEPYKMNISMHNKQQYKQQLELNLQALEKMKRIMIEDATNAINEQFNKWIGNPIYLLISTTEVQQQQRKRAMIYNQKAEKEQLLKIAYEIRQLNKSHFKDSQFIRVMMKRLTDQFSHSLKEAIDGQIKQLSAVAAQKMESLSPFSKMMVQTIEQQIVQERKIAQEKEWLQREEQRANFLSPYGKTIDLNGSLVSVEKWKESGQPFGDIQDLQIDQKNLEAIPFQIKFFPNLKILGLGHNKIKEIQNLYSLTKLQKLRLYTNQITQIKNLSKLINLRTLNLANNSITEIKGLEKLTGLKELYLEQNKISQIKGLDNLINLQTLYLQRNQIKKVENLEHLAKLTYLDLRWNPLEKTEAAIKMLKEMRKKGLQKLYLPQGWNI